MEVRHLSVSIARPAEVVYGYAADPRNLPAWAAGLARSAVWPAADGWWVESPVGPVRVRFAPRNAFGVLDHEVTLPTGETVHNPMRVVPHGAGSEVIFTLFRREDTTDRAFADDAAAVARDLATLKRLLEAPGSD